MPKSVTTDLPDTEIAADPVLERDGLEIERPSVSTEFHRLDARPAGDVDGDGADDFLLYRTPGDLWLVYGRTE